MPSGGTRYPRAVATAEGSALSSVDRALSVLEELARHGPLGATELANRTGCAKATAFRLARTLQARGFVVQNKDSTYRLGPRCLLLATGVHTSFDVRREALPAMEALGELTGETVQLTVLEGADVVYVEQVASSKPVRSVGTMGQRAPAHCVSGGLAQLALLPFERVRAHAVEEGEPELLLHLQHSAVIGLEALDAALVRLAAPIDEQVRADAAAFEQRHVHCRDQARVIVPIRLEDVLQQGPAVGDVVGNGFKC